MSGPRCPPLLSAPRSPAALLQDNRGHRRDQRRILVAQPTMAEMSNSVSDPAKRRAMDALARRFAAAKPSDVLQKKQTHLNRKQGTRAQEGPLRREDPSSPSPSSSVPSSTVRQGSDDLPKPLRLSDVERQGPAYFQLTQPVHCSLLETNFKCASSQIEGTAISIVRKLLQRGDSAQKYLQGSKSINFDKHYLPLDSVVDKKNASVDARKKTLQRQSKRSKRHMSLRQHRQCGSFHLPQKFHKFDQFVPMNQMWNEYVAKLLKNTKEKELHQSLLEADLHGAILLVVECKVNAFIRSSGIMIRETAETFGVITRENKFRVVPKRGSVFMLQALDWKITLYGDKLCSRNSYK